MVISIHSNRFWMPKHCSRFWQFTDTQNRQGPYVHRANILSGEWWIKRGKGEINLDRVIMEGPSKEKLFKLRTEKYKKLEEERSKQWEELKV